jgi:hypothetical protein
MVVITIAMIPARLPRRRFFAAGFPFARVEPASAFGETALAVNGAPVLISAVEAVPPTAVGGARKSGITISLLPPFNGGEPNAPASGVC